MGILLVRDDINDFGFKENDDDDEYVIDKDDDADSDGNGDEQTHGIVSFRGKLTAFFVIGSWAFGNPVAPGLKGFGDNYDDDI